MKISAWIKLLVTAVGFGLALAALLSDTVKSGFDLSYGHDHTTAGFLILLIALGLCSLLVYVFIEDERYLTATGAVGAITLGYFLFIPLTIGPNKWPSELDYGGWFGLVAGVLMTVGAAPTKQLFNWRRSPSRPHRSVYAAWLVGLVGLALAIVSIFLPLTSIAQTNDLGQIVHLTYWDSLLVHFGRHFLPGTMLFLAFAAVVCTLGAALLRRNSLGVWAIGSSLILLGILVWYPVTLAFNHLRFVRSGVGIGLGAGLLAAGSLTVAALVQRGSIKLDRRVLRLAIAAAGAVAALTASWMQLYAASPGSLWVSGMLGDAVLLLAFVVIVLVSLDLVLGWRWSLLVAGGLGWLLAGYYANNIATALNGHLSTLDAASWVGLAGGVVLALSTLSLRPLLFWRESRPASDRSHLAAWLAIGVGLALAVVGLFLPREPIPPGFKAVGHSYWNFLGNHSLGIVMLVLALSALVSAAVAARTRFPVAVTWTFAGTLALFGLSLYTPASEAFAHLGALRSGAWLALAGSLIAAAGATAIALMEQPPRQEASVVEAAPAHVGTPAKTRRTAKGRVPGMRTGK